MALTRKLLEGMGIEDKQIETIIEAHAETVNGLKAERDKYKEQAGKVPDLQKQLEEAQASAADPDEWHKKFDDEHKAFEDFKADVEAKAAQQAKASAYRKLLADASIDPRRIDAIMRVTDLDKVEMDGDGIKDAQTVTDEIAKEWADFVVKTKTEPTNPATPPTVDHTVEGADPEVAKRMQERHERMFGKTETKE